MGSSIRGRILDNFTFKDFSDYFLCYFFQVAYGNLKKKRQVRIRDFSWDDKQKILFFYTTNLVSVPGVLLCHIYLFWNWIVRAWMS